MNGCHGWGVLNCPDCVDEGGVVAARMSVVTGSDRLQPISWGVTDFVTNNWKMNKPPQPQPMVRLLSVRLGPVTGYFPVAITGPSNTISDVSDTQGLHLVRRLFCDME